jgi:ABC-2 type transport system permease protein
MREILTIALNDVRNTFSERSVLISLIVVPVIMTVFLGSALGGSDGSIRIDVIRAESAGTLGQNFVDLLKQEGGAGFLVCDLSDPAEITNKGNQCGLDDLTPDANVVTYAEKRIEDGVTYAAVILPSGFTNNLLAGKNVSIEQIGKNGMTAPQIISQKVDAVLTRINGALLAARVVTEKANPAQRETFFKDVYTTAEKIWASEPVLLEEKANVEGLANNNGGFSQSAPGMGAMFVLLNALGLASLFIREKQTGTLPRLMMFPLRRSQILMGKLFGRYLIGIMIFFIMVVVGTLFGVRWGNWLGVIVIVLVYTLAVTALALAFSTVAKTLGQAAGISLLMSLTLSPLGGAWWPISIVPQWMQNVGRISPVFWSQEAFNKLIFYGGTLVDILPAMAVLLIFAAACFAFGVARFKYE